MTPSQKPHANNLISNCCRLLVPLFLIYFLSRHQVKAQFISIDNQTGSWNDLSSWVNENYPGTSPRDQDIDCYGYLTSDYCLDFDKGVFQIHDTLIVYGSFSLLNNGILTVDSGAVLIIFGNYYSNNQTEVENRGNIIITGQFRMQGSDNQGFFHNNGGKVFLFDNDPEIKVGSHYADLLCADSSEYPLNCGYGNENDLKNDPMNLFFSAFNYIPPASDDEDIGCVLISFVADKTELCQYDTVIFYNQSTGISAASLYEWDFGEDAVPPVITGKGPHKVVYYSPGYKSVELIVTDVSSILTRKSAYINVIKKPDLEISDTSRCGAGEVLFTAQSVLADVIQFSDNGGESVLYQAIERPFTIGIQLNEGDSVLLYVQGIDTLTGCVTGWQKQFTGYAYISPNVRLVGDTVICDNEILSFTTNEVYTRYLWPDSTTLGFFSTNEAGLLWVEAWNEFNCSDIDSALIQYCSDEDIFNTTSYSFTPNYDGINDFWCIHQIENYPLAEISVYNISGEKVFYSPGGYKNDWDGAFNGRRLPIDSYHFIIDLNKYGKGAVIGIVTILYNN
jgi:gliding motility-associated-like protein